MCGFKDSDEREHTLKVFPFHCKHHISVKLWGHDFTCSVFRSNCCPAEHWSLGFLWMLRSSCVNLTLCFRILTSRSGLGFNFTGCACQLVCSPLSSQFKQSSERLEISRSLESSVMHEEAWNSCIRSSLMLIWDACSQLSDTVETISPTENHSSRGNLPGIHRFPRDPD